MGTAPPTHPKECSTDGTQLGEEHGIKICREGKAWANLIHRMVRAAPTKLTAEQVLHWVWEEDAGHAFPRKPNKEQLPLPSVLKSSSFCGVVYVR